MKKIIGLIAIGHMWMYIVFVFCTLQINFMYWAADVRVAYVVVTAIVAIHYIAWYEFQKI